MTSTSKVFKLDKNTHLAKSHDKLVQQITVLDWELQVQQIIKSMGLPLSELLQEPTTALAPSSHAAKCSHDSIESFITSSNDDFGLQMEWNEWYTKVNAYQIKKNYNLYTDDPVEIIQEFKDVTSYLGFKPSTSEEYHEAKDTIFRSQREQQDRLHSLQVKEMNEKVSDLLRQVNASTGLLQDAESKIQSLNAELQATRKNYDLQIDEAYKTHQNQLAEQLQEQRNLISKEFEAKIIEVEHQADLVRTQSQQNIDEIRAKYNSENYVSRCEFMALEQELEREREISRNELIKINELNQQISSLTEQLKDRNDIIAQLEEKIEEQVELINSLNLKIEKGEISGSDLTFEDYEVLQSEVSKLEAIVDSYKSQNERLVKKQEFLEDNINIAKSNMEKLKVALKKNQTSNKRLRISVKHKEAINSVLGSLVIVLITGLSLSLI